MKDAMDSKRQAALVWLSLSPEAKQVMQDRLGDFPEEVRMLAEELNAIESASREEVKVAIDGFYETRMENRYVRHGGHAQARAFVEGAVGQRQVAVDYRSLVRVDIGRAFEKGDRRQRRMVRRIAIECGVISLRHVVLLLVLGRCTFYARLTDRSLIALTVS